MSDCESDDCFSYSLLLEYPTVKRVDGFPLSEISERDKVWDEHRANSDTVASHYKGSSFDKYSQRMTYCSELLDFRLVPDADEGLLKLKLANARFCRVRFCCVCQWRRSLAWKGKAYRILPKVLEHYPKHRWLFLTLTIKNCLVECLRQTVDLLNKAFARLTKLKYWPADGWIKSLEVTHGRDNNAHPHLHSLIMVPAGYFGSGYLSQQRWAELWKKCLRIDYLPRVHVKAIAKHHNPAQIIPEILKYAVKESDLYRSREFLLELTKQLHNTKSVSVGGTLKIYFKELEVEPEDLIGDDGQQEVDEGHLYFGWWRQEKKYKLKE
jgi:plasmid rolling circle replication initiator protein Rep